MIQRNFKIFILIYKIYKPFGLTQTLNISILCFEHRYHLCQFQKTLGAFQVALGGLDAVVFTATAAERSPHLRALLCRDLSVLGVALDEEKNDLLIGKSGLISVSDAAVRVAVIRTNELRELYTVTEQF